MAGQEMKMVNELFLERGSQAQSVSAAHLAEDAAELEGGVVGKLNVASETGLESGIGVNEPIHLIGIPGDNKDQPVAVVFHALEQRLDSLVAKIFAFLGQTVGFIDEKNSIQGGINHGVGAGR